MAEWIKTVDLDLRLVGDGWHSPDTYRNHFATLVSGPAVYLFALFNREDFTSCVVAYVGMSTNLKRRMDRHEVLASLSGHQWWVQRWFKPTGHKKLREHERELIGAFDPPWNIIGRKRGLLT